MKVLYITNMFPNKRDITYGVFVKEQIDAVEKIEKIEKDIYVIEGKRGFVEYIRSIFIIPKLIAANKYDLIHIHYGLSGLFLLYMKPRIPVVITLHGGDIQIEQGKTVQVALTKRILRHCDFAITLNSIMNSIVMSYCRQTEIIPCSVNTNLFFDQGRRHKKNYFNILFPSARNREVKDYPLFQRTCNILRKDYALDIHEFYIENMSRKEVADLLNNMDILLMTSISEGSPQVVKEAMACNLPIVSTNVGDVATLLMGVNNCYVSDSRNEEELASKVYKALVCKETKGVSPKDQIFKLGYDDATIAKRILRVYHHSINH